MHARIIPSWIFLSFNVSVSVHVFVFGFAERHKKRCKRSLNIMCVWYAGLLELGVYWVQWPPPLRLWDICQPYLNQGADYSTKLLLVPPDFYTFLQPWYVHEWENNDCQLRALQSDNVDLFASDISWLDVKYVILYWHTVPYCIF